MCPLDERCKTLWTHIPTMDVPIQKIYESAEKLCRNRNHLKGSIAEAYICEEAIEFCSKFLSGLEPIGLVYFNLERKVGSIDR